MYQHLRGLNARHSFGDEAEFLTMIMQNLLFGSHQQLAKVSVPCVKIGNSSIPLNAVHNLRVLLDSNVIETQSLNIYTKAEDRHTQVKGI